MTPWVFRATKFLGWTALGFGLAVGWRLGNELVSVAMGEKDLAWPGRESGPNPLLFKKFSKVSE